MRYIKICEPIVLHDPITGAVMTTDDKKDTVVTFEKFINALLSNPKWDECLGNTFSAKAIRAAYGVGTHMVLTDSDWAHLLDAALNPKQVMLANRQMSVIPGYGYHPTVNPQFLPFVLAIASATTSPPAA